MGLFFGNQEHIALNQLYKKELVLSGCGCEVIVIYVNFRFLYGKKRVYSIRDKATRREQIIASKQSQNTYLCHSTSSRKQADIDKCSWEISPTHCCQ
jgi:cell division protein FtsL